MKKLRTINDAKQKMLKDAMEFRHYINLSKDFEKTQEMRKQQDEMWNKYLFYKNFLDATSKVAQ